MRQVGEVVNAEVFVDHYGRSAGCGIVEYESTEAADLAIQTLNDSVLDGRNIFVREDREPGKPRGEQRMGGMGRGGMHRGMGRDMDRGMGHDGYGSHISVTDRGYETRRGGFGYQGGGHGHPTRGPDKGRKIIVWNLPFHLRWQDLKDIFRNYGQVIRADVMLFPDGKSKGMGTVLFEREDEARRAIEEMTGKEIDGRVVDCRMDRFA